MSPTLSPPDLLPLVARIVSAHVTNNEVTAADLPALIQSVYGALQGAGAAPAEVAATKPEPAVSTKKSVFPDYIVCLEDGKRQKTLKRHLQTSHGLTPEAYRERWNLPRDYPMVAPSYAARRSALAKEIGLGRKAAPEEKPPAAVRKIAQGVSGKAKAKRRRLPEL